MDTIGLFLQHLFSDRGYSSKLPCLQSDKYINVPVSTVSGQDVLYSASKLNQNQIIRLILSIYGGVPQPFEHLRCSPRTTEQDLHVFMKRAIQHPRKYIIVLVNSLPFYLQEACLITAGNAYSITIHSFLQILLQLYLMFRQETITQAERSTLHFIETAPSVLQEIPWLHLQEVKVLELH